MKRKILSFLLIGVIFIGLTGCGKKQEEVKKEKNKLDIIGSWTLNRKVAVEDSNYNSLRDLFGDSLGSGEDALILNEDGTFSITLGVVYNPKGNYKVNENIITFNNIEDLNIKNEKELKEMEENLQLEYIEYNNHKFMKMKLYDYDFEGYIFFEKDPKEKAGSYADDEIPEVNFTNNTNEKTNDSREYTKTEDGIKINNYNIKYGTYSGKYKTSQNGGSGYTSEEKIKINSNDTITMYGPTGEESDYPFTIENNTIKVGNNTIEVVGNNKIKFTTQDVVLEYKGE